MSVFYLDSSAVVKRYCPELGSAWVKAMTDVRAGHTIMFSEITLAEVAAAFAAKSRAPQGLSVRWRDLALKRFLTDSADQYQLLGVQREIIDLAVKLTQRQKLRGCDAIHLAAALAGNEELLSQNLSPLTFVAADEDLLKAAEAEGLVAENPNSYP
jgi:predicted nucleic acid-binding protein